MDLRELAKSLHAADSNEGSSVAFWAVKRKKKLLLLLPEAPALALRSLSLYSPQRPMARFFYSIVERWLSWSFPVPFALSRIGFDENLGFIRFLEECGADIRGKAPFGVLAGNPKTSTRRWLFFTFKADGSPGLLVKAGFTTLAKARIRQEYEFLKSLSPNVPHVVKPEAWYEGPEAVAFAMRWIDGSVPQINDPLFPELFLSDWMDGQSTMLLEECSLWKTLLRHSPEKMEGIQQSGIGGRAIHPVLFHGDLAPWNVRIDEEGRWWVFDWERGDLQGIPGLNWLHYHIQFFLLVKRLKGPALKTAVDRLTTHKDWVSYLSKVGLQGQEKQILKLYLIYMLDIVTPMEGKEELAGLWKRQEA